MTRKVHTCQVCVNQCSFNANYFDAEENVVKSRDENCVDCQRCWYFGPTRAITITIPRSNTGTIATDSLGDRRYQQAAETAVFC